jgi:hypothetical protein
MALIHTSDFVVKFEMNWIAKFRSFFKPCTNRDRHSILDAFKKACSDLDVAFTRVEPFSNLAYCRYS